MYVGWIKKVTIKRAGKSWRWDVVNSKGGGISGTARSMREAIHCIQDVMRIWKDKKQFTEFNK